MKSELTSAYLERIRKRLAVDETVVVSDTLQFVPTRGGWIALLLPPKSVRDKQRIPIIYRRSK